MASSSSLCGVLVGAGFLAETDSRAWAIATQLEDAVELSPSVCPTLIVTYCSDAVSRAHLDAIRAHYCSKAKEHEGFQVQSLTRGIVNALPPDHPNAYHLRDPLVRDPGEVYVVAERWIERVRNASMAPIVDGCYLWCDNDASIGDDDDDDASTDDMSSAASS